MGGGSAKPRPFGGIVEQAANGGGKGRRITDRREQAGNTVGHDRGHATGAAGDDRQPGRLGFEEGHAIGFVDRGPQVKVGGSIERRQLPVRHGAHETHPIAERRHRRLDLGSRRSVAHQHGLP